MVIIKNFLLILILIIAGCNGKEEEPLYFVEICYKLDDLSASDVERTISRPIERLLSEIKEIKYVYSASWRNRALITAAIFIDVKHEILLLQIKNKLSTIDLSKTITRPEFKIIIEREKESKFCY